MSSFALPAMAADVTDLPSPLKSMYPMPVHRLRAAVGLLVITSGVLLSACIPASPQVVKIGFVAPFEGRYREIGVDTIPAARIAIRDWAKSHPDVPITIELVAYDDAGNPEQAVEQARKLVQDPQVEVVIGHWQADTTSAALPIYTVAGIPLVTYVEQELPSVEGVYNLAPSTNAIEDFVEQWASEQNLQFEVVTSTSVVDAAEYSWSDMGEGLNTFGIGIVWGLSQYYSLTEGRGNHSWFASGLSLPQHLRGSYWTTHAVTQFDADFRVGSLGAPPGFMSGAAYEACWLALDLLAAKYSLVNTASPAAGFEFDASQRRVDSAIYFYQWSDGERTLITSAP
jgi:hypothetical protein